MTSTSRTLTFADDHGRPALRFPAPDLARGLMLLIIAVANVTYWLPGPATIEGPDVWWNIVRAGFVEGRAYPLFACLFGFGLAVMVSRRVTPDADPAPTRRLLRRRGWWMIAFGLVHALLFAGDIIGLYGFIAVLFAGAVVSGRMLWPLIISGIVLVGFPLLMLAVPGGMGGTGGGAGGGAGGAGMGDAVGKDVNFERAAWPVGNLTDWGMGTVFGFLLSLALPAVVAGVFLARTTWLSRPREHVRLLTVIAVVGLTLGLATSLPTSLVGTGLVTATMPAWTGSLALLGGLAGAAGWLAVFGLIGAAVTGRPEPSTWSPLGILTATGRRSMTAYILQSVYFALLVVGLKASGLVDALNGAAIAGLAALGWLLIALVCAGLAAAGQQGPTERLLRYLVARTERTRKPATEPATEPETKPETNPALKTEPRTEPTAAPPA